MTRLRSLRRPLVGMLAALSVGMGAPLAPASADTVLADESEQGRLYPGDPKSESAYVAAEDDRLIEVNTVGTLTNWMDVPIKASYRLATGSAYTLVLTARREPYTIDDLMGLAPQTFVRRPDGSFLLSEHLVVQAGATLNLANSGGLELLLASDANGFVSIVNYGGRLNVAGTEGAPAVITSFDRETASADRDTEDGRAYIRSIGGQVSLEEAELSHLGFWSGRTGGLSLTGTDRPSSGALDDMGKQLDLDLQKQRLEAAGPGVPGNNGSPLGQVLPSGPLPVPDVDIESPQYSFVSAAIKNTTVRGNAFGVFVSGANGLDIRQSSFSDSLVDGLVMHRYVVNAVVQSTSASANGRDGIQLSRATTGIVLSEVEANSNGRNGVTMSGLPLADGPSATGMSVDSYGNNSVANSVASANGRYGVEVLGGKNIGVLANEVRANHMGIVIRDAAQGIDVVGNRVGDSVLQGIAIRDGVGQATVSGNIVTGGSTSIYLRDSVATIQNNTLTEATSHALSLVGEVGRTMIEHNTISGRGPSAIDLERAVDPDRRSWDNDTGGWDDTTPFLVTLKRFLQPLTAMWLLLGALLVFTAVRGARARRVKLHPYADKAPLSGRTLGPVEPESVALEPVP